MSCLPPHLTATVLSHEPPLRDVLIRFARLDLEEVPVRDAGSRGVQIVLVLLDAHEPEPRIERTEARRAAAEERVEDSATWRRHERTEPAHEAYRLHSYVG